MKPKRNKFFLLFSAMIVLTLIVSACGSLLSQPAMVKAGEGDIESIYVNPDFLHDFPDPFILQVEGVYYGYDTNSSSMHIQVIRSTDMINWEQAGESGDALPQLPDWAAEGLGLTWAPSVLQQDDKFILYYTTRYQEAGRQCISYAISDSPEGPFLDPNDEPFICQLNQGGSIDPEPFRDADGVTYLIWKNDGNCCSLPVWIYSQQLSADGQSLVGDSHHLIQCDQRWEKPLIENPSMVLRDGFYTLIYSANKWDSSNYAVGYAICESPIGPCEKPEKKPKLTSAGDLLGPGGASFFTDTKQNLWIAYHAWTHPYVGNVDGQRRLHFVSATIDNGNLILYHP